MSNASMLERLSCNIFITNFPTYFSSKDLWNTCSKFRIVLDVYIPNKVSKQGTKTSDSQKSHSNVPLNTSKPSYAKVLGKNESPQNHDEPVIVLDEGMLNFEGEPVLVGCGKVYVVRAKEVTGWVPDFREENSNESEDYSDNNSAGKKNWVESEEGEIIPESVQNDAFIDNIAESKPING
nr:ChaC-like family protein [Tanacetum cinerariifolium]